MKAFHWESNFKFLPNEHAKNNSADFALTLGYLSFFSLMLLFVYLLYPYQSWQAPCFLSASRKDLVVVLILFFLP